MADKTNLLQRLGRAAKRATNSPGGKIISTVLKGTPVGTGIQVAKDIVDIFGGNENASEDSLAEMIATASPESLVKLEQVKADVAIARLEADASVEIAGISAATERHRNDMLGDNEMSKNLRPWVCIGLTAAAVSYTFLALLSLIGSLILQLFYGFGDLAHLSSNPLIGLAMTGMVSLWAAAGTAIGFYFRGRTIEKKFSMESAVGALMGQR